MDVSEIGTFFLCTSFATQCAPDTCSPSQPRRPQREWAPKMHGGPRGHLLRLTEHKERVGQEGPQRSPPHAAALTRPELARLVGRAAPQPPCHRTGKGSLGLAPHPVRREPQP